MKKIAKLLKADLNGTSDLAAIAAMLAGKGRGNDTLLAHITPKEAEILKAAGGSGTTNPETGLLEFYDDFEAMPSSQAEFAQAQQAAEPSPVYDYGDVRAEAPIQAPAQTAPTTPSAGLNFPLEVPGQQYAPTIVERPDNLQESLRQQYAPQVARTDVVSRFDQPEEKSFFDKLTTEQMTRLGLAGGLGILGAQRARQGAGQIQAATQEQKALAQPYQTQGQELVRAAQSGELTPASQQSLQAMQARVAQGVEARGGVGAQQAAAQIESLRQQLLQNQYTYGLQIAQVGDNIALGAIRTGLQLDNSLQQATGNFYTNLAMVAGGIPMARTTT
jgi:hypothetical protein